MSVDKKDLKKTIENRKKRSYNKKTKKQSPKKLGISEEHGWTSTMRTTYYQMTENFHQAIEKIDYTNLKNRPEGLRKRDVKKAGPTNSASDIWSDSYVTSVKKSWDRLIKFIIEENQKEIQEAREKGEPYKRITKLSQIKSPHIEAYIKKKLTDGTCTAKTVRDYVTFIEKGEEGLNKIGLTRKLVKQKHKDLVPEIKKKDIKRGVGKTDGQKGMSLDNSRKLIEHFRAKDDIQMVMTTQILTYIGPRKGTMLDMTWDKVLDESGAIATYADWTKDVRLKNNRKQIAEINDATEGLKQMWETGLFKKSDKVVNMTEYHVRKNLKNACNELNIDFKGLHSFRSATLEYYEKEKLPNMNREEIVDKILEFVNIEIIGKDGKPYKPHNDIVKKEKPARDKNGKVIIKKNRKGGKYVKMVAITDEKTGQAVRDYRWTKEELMNCRIDYLKGLYIAQQISHNRTDVNNAYRNYQFDFALLNKDASEFKAA